MRSVLTLAATLTFLVACSEAPEPQAPKPPQLLKSESSKSETAAAKTKAVVITAPSGEYKRDAAHSTLSFSVSHLGLSNYEMRFSDYSINLTLDAENPSASSVRVEIDPTSVDTDYTGDYQATHPKSSFTTWEEDLAQSPKFLNASEHPSITFESTRVSTTPEGTLDIQGDLTLLGQTNPVTLEAEIVGDAFQHPFMGMGAIGFSVSGTFKRSDFGMTHLLQPPLVGDEVTLSFEGELHQVVEDSASAE